MVESNQREVYTFSPGPSIFPLEVLKQAQAEMLNYKNCGISVLEMSHRSKEFMEIFNQAEKDFREFLQIPDNFKVLFLQGGATLQFSAVPLNLLGGEKKSANYILTGHWSEKAIAEAKKYGTVVEVVNSKEVKDSKFSIVPPQDKWKVDSNAAYFYYCDNETIAGMEFPAPPQVKDQILVCDMSSNFCSRPVDWKQYGVVFACAQKNFGPAGVTIVVVRDDLLNQKQAQTPIIMEYKLMADNQSLYNTGPTYSIYLAGLFVKYLRSKGDIKYWDEQAKLKSNMIYEVIDSSNGFYKAPAQKEYRSRLNIPFLIKGGDENVQKKFLKEAEAIGLIQLEGHRSVGGLRASIYNGMPVEGVQKLKDFMIKFMNENK